MEQKKKWVLLFLLLSATGLLLWGGREILTMENLLNHRQELKHSVERNYALSVLLFLAAHLGTAFILPGQVLLVLVGGFLFGNLQGTFYVELGMTAGGTLAFLTSRYLIGDWINRRYEKELISFNREIERRGRYYLLTLRITPVFPFFLLNYLAGLTTISLKAFILTTALGGLPGTVILTLIGQRLAEIQQMEDVFTLRVYLALFGLGCLAILPALVSRWQERTSPKPPKPPH